MKKPAKAQFGVQSKFELRTGFFRLWRFPLTALTSLIFIAATPPKPLKERPVVPFELFFQELRSHGAWRQLDDGRWAWQPVHTEPDWKPFGRGTWVFTIPQSAIGNPQAAIANPDWYWLSNDPWGWATSHYGHWKYRPAASNASTSSIRNPQSAIRNSSGWFWLPDDMKWSPARAVWREGEPGFGWHALEPTTRSAISSAIGDETGYRADGWTFLFWRDIARALIPGAGGYSGGQKIGALEGLLASSATTVAGTAALLAQTRFVADAIAQSGDVYENRGIARSELAAKIPRKIAPCPIVDTHRVGELLVVARDETVVAAFRPIVKENAEEIQKFLAQRAERYRALEKRKEK